MVFVKMGSIHPENDTIFMKLEITKERILEAAAKCSTAKQTLQVLFPEAFKQNYPLKVGDIYVHPTNNISPMLLIQAHYNQDAYILLGNVHYLCYSSLPHAKTMTLAEVEAYLDKCGHVFSHNVREKILELFNI